MTTFSTGHYEKASFDEEDENTNEDDDDNEATQPSIISKSPKSKTTREPCIRLSQSSFSYPSSSSTSHHYDDAYNESSFAPTPLQPQNVNSNSNNISSTSISTYHNIYLGAPELLVQLFDALQKKIIKNKKFINSPSYIDEHVSKCFSTQTSSQTSDAFIESSGTFNFNDSVESTANRLIQAIADAQDMQEKNLSIYSVSKFDRHMTVFAACDPDAVCAVALLKEGISERFGLNVNLIPISCYTHLQKALTLELLSTTKKRSLQECDILFFINVGSRKDVRNFFKKHNSHSTWQPSLFIIDHHRPVSPEYFVPSKSNLPYYSIVCTTDEIEKIQEETRRFNLWKNCCHITERDPDWEDEFIQDHSTYRFLDGIGEYHSSSSSLVILEALRHHSLETPGMFFTVATALAYQLSLGILSRTDYVKHLGLLQEHFQHLKNQISTRHYDFQMIKAVSKELLIPLLRFTSIEDGVRNSALFLRAQASRFATPDVIEQELSSLRVVLALKEESWKDQFRFLTSSEQKQLITNQLPEVLQRETMQSRQSLPKRYPDDQETQYLTSTLAFVRYLSIVGLPDRVSSLDVAFLLLSILSQPLLCKNQRSSEEPGSASTLYNSTHPISSLTINETSSSFSDCSFALSVKPFVEALQFIESVANISKNGNVHLAVFPDQSNSFKNLSISANDTLLSTNETDSSLHFFGNIWDAYVAYNNHSTQSYVTSLSNSDWHRILARLSRVALQLQRDATRFVLHILRKRRSKTNQMSDYRRAAENVEGFFEDALPQQLYHPLLLRYCAFITSDCIARGVLSALPDVMFFVTAPPDHISSGSTVLSCSPNASMRTPSKLGLHLYHKLNSLKHSGMIHMARQNDFDASVAFLPNNKLHTLFTALFTSSLDDLSYRSLPVKKTSSFHSFTRKKPNAYSPSSSSDTSTRSKEQDDDATKSMTSRSTDLKRRRLILRDPDNATSKKS
ncbi:uncharacterized protein LOC128882525 [Hylaeus volcanicus]|uniref:uncharacterized protein LOC128882525 n=1 Tax=Hylaeus volcanicus TaxID=313075 RepID=UPI0023B7FBA7|nr:uncharacterized protein LOC128882525 [Hylaeus volcanicus]